MKEKSYISIIVCINQDSDYLRKFIPGLNTYLSKKFINFELILVNNTGGKIGDLSKNLLKKELSGHVNIINLPWKHNIESAMLSGINLSIGDFIVEIDSPENIASFSIIKRLFKKCTDGFDIVSAISNSNKNKLNTSSWFYSFLKRFSNLGLDLNSESIRIITRRALNSALRSKEKVNYRQISYYLTGFPIAKIFYNPNTKYHSNKNLSDKVSFALEIILSHTDIGIKITLALSLFFFLISSGVGFYAIYQYFTLNQIATGWTTTMLFLSFGFSSIFLITGILTKYLMMVLVETKERSVFTIQSIEKLK